MIKFTCPICLIFIALFTVLLSGSVFSQNDLKWVDLNQGKDPKNYSSSLPFFPHRAKIYSDAYPTIENFSDAEVCGSCHVEIYSQWKGSMMRYSWDDPIYRALLKKASEATDGAIDQFCTGCHTPIGLATRHITSDVNQMKGEQGGIELPGVDCESCHNMSGRSGLDNGAYELTVNVNSPPVKYGPRDDAVSPFHETEYSELHTRSDFCSTCHNVTHPFNNVPIERTYDEWLESPYSKEGVACQDCHMPTFKGKAAIMGPEREDVASHRFQGANSTVLSHLNEDEAAELARDMLKSAAKISIEGKQEDLLKGVRNTVRVKVRNTGAGHKLPTGFPEGREVWIDFLVIDGEGKEIYRLGKVKDGKTESGTKNFKVYLGNKDGEPVDIKVWEVTHVISDNRILPKGYSIEEFDFVIPEDSVPPYKVKATLNYWAFPQALVDNLLGEGVLEVDIVEMAEVSKVFGG